ncbi:leucine-rich repeat-containing protein 57-like [Ornithodoros turicata]|uniref:Putative leucine-rich repeat lrr protein n=1 Tax=Ornithodoros turicata TaxID=34597 RepID=A0A2R5LGS1_9ACAR
MGNSIKPHIQNAGKTGVCQLSNSNLREFPKELFLISGVLRTLDISENKISVVPTTICKFEQMKHLTMNNNRISSLPDSMCKLTKLESVQCSGNQLTRLPDSFSQLTNLRTLVLSGNRLSVFPRWLSSLKHLDVVDLSRNRIAEVPDSVGELTATELNLNQNQISLMSENIANCPRLKVLRLEENCLQLNSIPTRLLADSHVSLLAVEGNLFELKDMQDKEGYEAYMERYTATKKKMF